MYSGDPFARIDVRKLSDDLYDTRKREEELKKQVDELTKENERLKANYLFIVGKSITIADHYLSIMDKIGGDHE